MARLFHVYCLMVSSSILSYPKVLPESEVDWLCQYFTTVTFCILFRHIETIIYSSFDIKTTASQIMKTFCNQNHTNRQGPYKHSMAM